MLLHLTLYYFLKQKYVDDRASAISTAAGEDQTEDGNANVHYSSTAETAKVTEATAQADAEKNAAEKAKAEEERATAEQQVEAATNARPALKFAVLIGPPAVAGGRWSVRIVEKAPGSEIAGTRIAAEEADTQAGAERIAAEKAKASTNARARRR